MKPLNSLRLGMTFAGCFLGAGYVSGQEILQFFGIFGASGWAGLFAALLILSAAGCLLLQMAFAEKQLPPDRLILGGDFGFLRGCLTVMQLLFLFSVSSVMTAGAGALVNQLTGISPLLGSLAFTTLLFFTALRGIEPVIYIFSLSVPLLTAVSVACSLLAHPVLIPEIGADSLKNPLIGGWLTGGVTFASYNLFSSIGIFVLLGRRAQTKQSIYGGTLLGTGILFLIAAAVLCAVNAHPEIHSAQLPMLALASSLHPILEVLYAALLLTSMFGTALSCTTALTEQLQWYIPRSKGRRRSILALLSAASFTASLAGFSGLVGTAYPLFGYCSSIFIVCLFFRFIRGKVGGRGAQ